MTEKARDYYSKEVGELDFPHYSNSELAALQQRALAGDREAWEALWLHGVRMVTKLCKRLRNLGILYAEDWEDAVQEGNLAIGQALPHWSNNQGRYSTYVWTCIRNAVVDYTTRQKRGGVTGEIDWDQFQRRTIDQSYRDGWKGYLITDLEDDDHNLDDARIESIDLLSALDSCLNDQERDIIDRYYLRDQGDPEIAVYLGISKQAVGQKRNKALEALRLYFS